MNIDDFFKVSPELFSKPKREDGIYREKLVFKPGNEYVVRLLPYLKEGREEAIKKSICPYGIYAWQSILDGRWQYVLSPKSWGERCPITEFYFKAKNSKNEATQAKLKGISYKEGCYYNVYVVDDPTNPANNGTVKILQAGKQLSSIIAEAASDEPKVKEKYREELDIENMRQAMFDLSEKGINLCINVQDQGGFCNYKSSTFVRRKRDLGLSQDEINEIYQKVFDLTTIDRRRTGEEVEELFCKTFLGLSDDSSSKKIEQPVVVEAPVITDDMIPSSTAEPSSEAINIDDIESYLAEQNI